MEEDAELGSVRVPGDGGELRLLKKGDTFTLQVHDTELMTSVAHASEDALGELACARLSGVPEAVVLIGGLGMGFTLSAAIKTLGPRAKVIVAELIPAVVEWNRGPLAHLAGHPLSDPRVTVAIEDVVSALRRANSAYDAILLDVDNGPEGLTRDSNNWLYSNDGLAASYAALRSGGILAVWSAAPERSFAMRMEKVGFAAEEVRVPTGSGHDRNVIWMAVKP